MLAAPAAGLALFTTGCEPLTGTDRPATTAPATAPASPTPKALDAAALLAATLSAQEVYGGITAEAAEERRPGSINELSNPVCRQFLTLMDGGPAPVVVTQPFSWKDDPWGGGTTIAAYRSPADAQGAFDRLRDAGGACPSFSKAGDADARVVTVVHRPAPAEGDEAMAFTLAADIPGAPMLGDHVVTRVGAVIVDFRKDSLDGQGEREFPTLLMSRQVSHLVRAQR